MDKSGVNRKIRSLLGFDTSLETEFVEDTYMAEQNRSYVRYWITEAFFRRFIGSLSIEPFYDRSQNILKAFDDKKVKPESKIPVCTVSQAEIILDIAQQLLVQERELEGIKNLVSKSMDSEFPKEIRDKVLGKLEVLNEREELVWRVNHYCAITGKKQADVWSDIYRQFFAVINETIEPKNSKESRLQAVERRGFLGRLRKFVFDVTNI